MASSKGKNLPEDYNFSAEKMAEAWGPMAKNHVYTDGEYVPKPYIHQEYPKNKYHADYVHDQKPGIIYKFTESAQLVADAEEEKALGEDWKDSPLALGIMTLPDEKAVALRRIEEAKQGQNWRRGASIPTEQVTEKHLEFAQTNGVPNLNHMGDLYKFLATLTAAQMRDFMKEAAEVGKPEVKRGPGRPKSEAVVA